MRAVLVGVAVITAVTFFFMTPCSNTTVYVPTPVYVPNNATAPPQQASQAQTPVTEATPTARPPPLPVTGATPIPTPKLVNRPLHPNIESEISQHGFTEEELNSIADFAKHINTPKCYSDETNAAWKRELDALSPQDRNTWRGKGRTRRSDENRVLIPCPEASVGWVNPGGYFRPVPFWSHCCNKGPAIIQCEGDLVDPNVIAPCYKSVSQQLSGRCTASALPYCASHIKYLSNIPKPVVYGFGIGGEWEFQDFWAEKGYEVHGFDPTTNLKAQHESHKKPGVTFHYRGLRGKSQNMYRSQSYGHVGGPLYTLEETMKDLGHKEVHVLQVDCEGCEWEAFDDILSDNGRVIQGLKVLILEIHIAPYLGLRTHNDVKLFGRFWRRMMDLGFRLYFYHDNPCPHTHPFLRAMGMDGSVCAHELGFYRP